MPRRRSNTVNGWVMLDKPLGLTSRQALNGVCKKLATRTAGHAGTLDPAASGLLPVAVGESTKLIPLIAGCFKTYEFILKWGEATDSDDSEGQIIARSDVLPNKAAILAVLPKFIGNISQYPPKYSAVKIAGVRAYKKARLGEEFEIKPRMINVKNLRLIKIIDNKYAQFELTCGGGTYVRSIARDMAIALKTLAHVVVLRRTSIGNYSLSGISPTHSIEDDINAEQITNLVEPTLLGVVEGIAEICGQSNIVEVADSAVPNLIRGHHIVADTQQSYTKSQKQEMFDSSVMDNSNLHLAEQETYLLHNNGRAIALCLLSDGYFHPKRVLNCL